MTLLALVGLHSSVVTPTDRNFELPGLVNRDAGSGRAAHGAQFEGAVSFCTVGGIHGRHEYVCVERKHVWIHTYVLVAGVTYQNYIVKMSGNDLKWRQFWSRAENIEHSIRFEGCGWLSPLKLVCGVLKQQGLRGRAAMLLQKKL